MGKLAKHIKQKSGNTNSKKKFKKHKFGPDKGKENRAEEKRKKQNRDDSEDDNEDNDMNMDFDDNESPDTFYNFSSAASQLSSDWVSDHEEDEEDDSQQTLEEIVASKGLEKFAGNKINDSAVKTEEIPFQRLDCLTDMIREKLKKFKKIPVTKQETNILESILKGIDVNKVVGDTEGKRLAISVAALELVIRRSFTDFPGTAVVIIVKNYKDAKSIEGFLNYISQDLEPSIGLLVGGKAARSEEMEVPIIQKGLDIVIATSTKLLYHLKNTSGFSCKDLTSLIIDEADFFMKNKSNDLFEICSLISDRSQTVVLSSKQTEETEKLTKTGTKKSPSTSLPHDQAYLACPIKRKFQILHAILETNRRRKVIVFMRTSSQVEFFGNILYKLDLAVLHLDESQTEEARTKYLNMFKNACAGIMLATDNAVAKHEFPRVSVVIHFDAPEDFKQYITRVNKLSESEKNTTSFMLMTKDEENILQTLRKRGMQLQSISADLLAIDNIQPEVVKTLRCTPHLRSLGVKAVKHYLTSRIEKLHELDLEEICFNFGFVVNSGRIDDAKLFKHIKEYLEKAEEGKLTEEDEKPVDLDHFEEDESDDPEDDDVVGVIGYYKGQTLEKQRKQNLTYHEWKEEQTGKVKSPFGVSGRGAKGAGARRGSHSGRGRAEPHTDRWNRSFDKGEKHSDTEDGGDEKSNKRRKRKQISKKVKKRINAEKRLKRLGSSKRGARSGVEKKEERRNFANTRGRPGFNRRGK